jgi:hypothetical protein
VNIPRRLERLEAAAREATEGEVERVVMDDGEGYRVDVCVPAGMLAKIARVYGEGGYVGTVQQS